MDDKTTIKLSGHRLVAVYRVVMAVLSLWIDFCVFKICKTLGVQHHIAALLLASSYVTLTFQTRTFSNSFEALLFVTLIMLILRCMTNDQKCVRQRSVSKLLLETDHTKDTTSDIRDNTSSVEEDLDSSFNDLHRIAFVLRKRNRDIDVETKAKGKKRQAKSKATYSPYATDSDDMVTHLKEETQVMEEQENSKMQEIGMNRRGEWKYSEIRETGPAATGEQKDMEIREIGMNRRGEQKYSEICETGPTATGDQKNIERREIGMIETEQKYSYLYVSLLALTIIVGIFNRPTFVLFAICPCLWLTDHFRLEGHLLQLKRLIVLGVTMLMVTALLATMDTVYYNNIELASLCTLHGWRHLIENSVITPLHFLSYNMYPSNLTTHGRHPFYTNLLVNMPLLFGPMLIYLTKYIVTMFPMNLSVVKIRTETDSHSVHSDKSIGGPSISVNESIASRFKGAIWVFITVPTVLLSCFPHQEPRFLVPLLPLVVISTVILSDKLRRTFWIVFILFNIVLSCVFGILHQGGILPCLMRLQQITQKEDEEKSNTSMLIIFSHTYMPPKHVLVSRRPNLELLDLKGNSLQIVVNKLIEHRNNSDSMGYVKSKVFLVLPGTLVAEFKSKYSNHVVFKSEEKFFPHLSFEDPPDIKLVDSLNAFVDLISLYMIEIE